MPAKRIPDLPSLTGAGSNAADLLLIYDADLDISKCITRSELAQAILGDLPDLPSLGTMAAQNANAVAITGGSISGVTLSGLTAPLALASGGTGGTDAATARAALTAAKSGVNSDITQLTALSTPITVAQGGTGAATAAGARANLGAAASGANSDITSLSGLTTPLSVAQGGTGTTSLASLATAMGALAVVAQSIVANNGNLQLSNGLILKWGKYQPGANIGQGTYGMTFSPVFPTAAFIVMATAITASSNADAWVEVEASSLTVGGWSCRVQADTSGNKVAGWYWFAIGN